LGEGEENHAKKGSWNKRVGGGKEMRKEEGEGR